MKKLIKSYKFWTTLAGAVGIFLTAISDFANFSINVQGAKEVIMAFCGILVAIGVVKIPHKKEQTKDTENLNNQNAEQELKQAKKEKETEQNIQKEEIAN